MEENKKVLKSELDKLNDIIMAQVCHHSECANCPMHGKCYPENKEVYEGDFVQEEFWEKM